MVRYGTWAQIVYKLVSRGKLEQTFELVLANLLLVWETLFPILH